MCLLIWRGCEGALRRARSNRVSSLNCLCESVWRIITQRPKRNPIRCRINRIQRFLPIIPCLIASFSSFHSTVGSRPYHESRKHPKWDMEGNLLFSFGSRLRSQKTFSPLWVAWTRNTRLPVAASSLNHFAVGSVMKNSLTPTRSLSPLSSGNRKY